MKISPAAIDGVFVLEPITHSDPRGILVKTVFRPALMQAGITFEMAEAIVSVSHRNVLRGLHYQAPPTQQARIIHCVQGAVRDVLVDLRHGSPSLGQSLSIRLDGQARRGLYVPPGLAHGYFVESETAIISYLLDREYAPDCARGIRWDSVPDVWPAFAPGHGPILSDADRAHPALSQVLRSGGLPLRDAPDADRQP